MIGVLIIHGVGSQQINYSYEFQQKLKTRLKHKSSSFIFHEIHWAGVLSCRESQLLTSMKSANLTLDWTETRKWIVHNSGDALAYSRGSKHKNHPTAYDLIHDVVECDVKGLKSRIDRDASIVIIAHSLGATIISDYIWDCQNNKSGRAVISNLVGLVTFGSTIPLFTLNCFDPPNNNYPEPIQFPGVLPSHRHYGKARWLNYFDRDDVLGWPLKSFYDSKPKNKSQTIARIEDYEINVGWTPFCHQKYWTHKNFLKPTADFLYALV